VEAGQPLRFKHRDNDDAVIDDGEYEGYARSLAMVVQTATAPWLENESGINKPINNA
jgi:hypothetical protein